VKFERRSVSRSRHWAELRFSIIGHLLARPPERGELAGELERLAGQTWQHPASGAPLRFGVSTIERWYYKALAAKQDPVSALARNTRKDRGRDLAVTGPLAEALLAQYREHPSWSYKLHADNLAALVTLDSSLGQVVPSYSTVRRFLAARGLLRQRRRPSRRPGAIAANVQRERREVRSFEVEHVGGLWHLDFHHGSRNVLGSDGRWRKPYLLGVLDDHSRLCCHMQWYLAESAENLIHALSQAFLKRGLPRSLMTDNGSAMIAAETTEGLLRLGIIHHTTLPYTPEQNAKQEVFWAQVEGRLMAMLEGVADLTLATLNETTLMWMEAEYNRRTHREIGVRPVDRFTSGSDVLRPSPSPQELRLAFMAQTTRSVRRSDATISLGGVRWEIPWQYRHLPRIWVRAAAWDLTTALLVDGHSGAVIATLAPLDKTRNADGRRRTVTPGPHLWNDPPTTSQQGTMAPLLRKMRADYAATGALPAYLPKDESIDIADADNSANLCNEIDDDNQEERR